MQLTKEIYTIGRSQKCSIVIDYELVSRHHATLIKTTERGNNFQNYSILDGDLNGKKSSNGIFINGNYQLSCQLKDGDIIQFAPYTFTEVPIKIKYLIIPINEADSYLKLDQDEDSCDPSEIRLQKENYKETIVKVRDFWDELA